jgi:hypothetical protein
VISHLFSMTNRELANTEVDVKATLRRRWNTNIQIYVPIDDTAISDVNKRVTIVQVSTEAVALTRKKNRIGIRLTQISWTVSLIYNWMFINILYLTNKLFRSLLDLRIQYIKISHNFLPGLVSSNLNADLSLSVLRKKTISKLKLWTLMLS